MLLLHRARVATRRLAGLLLEVSGDGRRILAVEEERKS
jgi:hypothetical protein